MGVEILTPIDRLWRRDVRAHQSTLVAQADNGVSVTLNEVDLNEGEWIVIAADDTATKVGAASVPNVFMIFHGGQDRRDTIATGNVTVIMGQYEANTTVFAAGVYAAGTELTAQNGQIEAAASGDWVIGHAFGAVVAGKLHFHNYNAGYVKA